MSFINETMHPNAVALYRAIARSAVLDANGEADYYTPMVMWAREHDYYDEKAADLYARVAEMFEAQSIHTLTAPVALSKLSRCLWQTAKVYH